MQASPAERPTILVVDDEPQIRRALRHALDPEIGRVLEAETARQAIDLAASRQPALIVLDLGLPDQSGAVFSFTLRRAHDEARPAAAARIRERAAELEHAEDARERSGAGLS